MLLVAAVFCVLWVAVGRSPNTKYLEELVRNNAIEPIVPEDILEDARLDVPELVRKNNYPVEEHFVITPDGYILGLHRIPHGRANNTQVGNKPVVFVMHGILCSSADWVLTGPGTALAYILSEEGFDVWLGNNRGNYYSRRHLTLNPDDESNRFWQFTLDDMGNLDLTTSIDYILRITGRPNLHYVGMSQGTTVYFVMGSLRPEYNEKILSVHALAPVVFTTADRSPLVDSVASYIANIVSWASEEYIGEIFPKSSLMAWIGRTYCSDHAPTQFFCSAALYMLGGWNENQHNATLLPVKLAHTPAGSSLRQFAHLTQNLASKSFRRYDYGLISNLIRYGDSVPPSYNLKNIKSQIFLHYSHGDTRMDEADVRALYDALEAPKEMILVNQKTFSHLDFMWGTNAREQVYDRVISDIRRIENSRK